MAAWLVVLALVLGPNGPMTIGHRLPWLSMETCHQYLKDPTPIDSHFGGMQVLQTSITCRPRVEKEV